MNFSNRVHWWAKATIATGFFALLSSILWIFPVPTLLGMFPAVSWLVFSLSWMRWMELAEDEAEAFQNNEPELSKEIE